MPISSDSNTTTTSSYDDDSETLSNNENKKKRFIKRQKKTDYSSDDDMNEIKDKKQKPTLKRNFIYSSDEDKQNDLGNGQKQLKLAVQNDAENVKKTPVKVTKKQSQKRIKKDNTKIREKKEKQYVLGSQIFKESLLLSHFKNALNHTPIIFFPCPCQSKTEK